ncbi:MAG TPA: hypothetical protein VMX94_12290 [Armatimonadota bacterium]|nr:hypothetical protein [Armatimonadota bacterium]
MQCPRCGADNNDARVACWNCFAQLHAPASAKPRNIELTRPKAVPAMPPQQEPTPTPPPEPVVAPPPQIAEEEPEAAAPEPLDLGEPAAESPFIIPGLAEPLPEVEQEAEQVEPLVVTPVEGEVETSAQAPHVLDLDEFEKDLETPESPGEPKAEEPEDEA